MFGTEKRCLNTIYFVWGEGYLELMCHVFNILPFLFKERLRIHCEIKICVSVQFSHSVVSDSLRPHELQHARPPCPSPTPRVHPNSCPSSRWCHPAISSSIVPFSSCPQSLPESGSFPMSQLFVWGGQSIGVSALASVLPKNTQDWPLLEWTGWISLQSKGLSRVFSNTTVQNHQFFGTQVVKISTYIEWNPWLWVILQIIKETFKTFSVSVYWVPVQLF